MDLSNFRTGDWLIVAGAAVMLIFGLVLDWASLDTGSRTISGNNAFDYFFTGGIAWLLTVAAGVITFLLVGAVIKASTVPWTLLTLLGTGLATLLMLLRLILGGGEVSGTDLDRGAGMLVAFVAAAVALGGAVMNYTREGGNLKDLTDIDKLRRAFTGPGDRGSSLPPPR